MFTFYYPYLKRLLVRLRVALGGGSLFVIVSGIVEHLTLKTISWAIYSWILVTCCVVALVRDGAEQYRRLAPRIVVRNLKFRVWPLNQHGFTGVEYYFEIFNRSEAESLEEVSAEVVAMCPDAIGYLPVPLHVKHDSGYETRECSVNPGSTKQIDLVTGPISHHASQKVMIIAHTVNAERVPIPLGKYNITVRVSANKTPPVTAPFEAWINAQGELKCVLL